MILFTMKDPGGTQTVLPVAKKLNERGIKVPLFATGIGAKILANEEKLPFADIEQLDQILAEKPEMLISSIDTGTMTVDVTKKAQQAGIPVAWIQDLWGNHIKPNWDGSIRPDYIFTLDDIGGEKILESWPGYTKDHIFPFGQPKFDVIAQMQFDSRWQTFKASLNARGTRIISVAGQIAGMLDCIQHLVPALNEIGVPVFVDFMHHGRCPAEMVEDFRKEYPNLKVGLATELEKVERNQRLLMADALFTMFSTDAVNASVLGKHVISCLLPEGRASFEKEGYTGQFSLTEAGCCLGVSTHEELVSALEKVLRRPNERHHRNFETDGKSAERIVNKIVELIR